MTLPSASLKWTVDLEKDMKFKAQVLALMTGAQKCNSDFRESKFENFFSRVLSSVAFSYDLFDTLKSWDESMVAGGVFLALKLFPSEFHDRWTDNIEVFIGAEL